MASPSRVPPVRDRPYSRQRARYTTLTFATWPPCIARTKYTPDGRSGRQYSIRSLPAGAT